MRTTAMWLLLGVFALLVGQPSVAGTGNHAHTRQHAAQRAPAIHRYVAIGDSYSSGAGIPPDPRHGCWRSTRNYPNQVAERLGAKLDDATCGGATTAHAEVQQPIDTGANPPQLSKLDRRTDLVTVGIGINDAGFLTVLQRCLTTAAQDPSGSPCRESFQTGQGDSLMALVASSVPKVKRVLDLVRAKAPGARVLLIGYPQLIPAAGTCADLPFAEGDYAYMRQYFVAVDKAMASAAERAGVDYLSLLEPSAGHDSCAGEEAWVIGNRTTEYAFWFHPYGREQRAIRNLVVEALGVE